MPLYQPWSEETLTPHDPSRKFWYCCEVSVRGALGGANKGAVVNNGARDKSSGGARVGLTKREDDKGIEDH